MPFSPTNRISLSLSPLPLSPLIPRISLLDVHVRECMRSHKSTSSWGMIKDAFKRVTGIGAKKPPHGTGSDRGSDDGTGAPAAAAAPAITPVVGAAVAAAAPVARSLDVQVNSICSRVYL